MGNLNLFRCSKYEAGQKFCKLCIEEKLAIALYKEHNDLLNYKTEILNKCRHRKTWLLD